MEPIPIGTLVEYNDRPGERYIVTVHADPQDLFPMDKWETLDSAYPDNVAYEIWKEGVLRRFGNRMYMYYRVRRTSLTILEENNAGTADPP